MATGNAVRIYASKSQGSLCSRVVAGASSVILVSFMLVVYSEKNGHMVKL